MQPMIYLDHAATAPMTPAALEAYARAAALPGNAASVHAAGQRARALLEEGRDRAAQALGAEPRRLLLTGSATESINTVLRGVLRPGDHLVTSAVEHSAVLATALALEAAGVSVTRLAPDAQGRVSPEALRAAITPETRLVSLQWVNNELGTVQDILGYAAACRAAGVLLHLDGVQGPGVFPTEVSRWDCDFASFSAHKWGGPKGVGYLYHRADFAPLLTGGGQEAGLRGGTHNVAGVYAAGVAASEAAQAQPTVHAHLQALKARLLHGLQGTVDFAVNSPPDASPRILNLRLSGDGEALLMTLDLLGVQASLGSACSAGTLSPSHVLLAVGLEEAEARASLRLSFGPAHTPAEIDRAAEMVVRACSMLG